MPVAPRSPFGAPLALAMLLGAAVPAQRLGDARAAKRPDHFDLTPTLQYLAGHCNAAAAPATIAEAAWLMMAFLANDSTMRSGPHRAPLKNLTKWLREQQDDTGRFAIAGEPGPRSDHLLATEAMTWCCVVSNYTLLTPVCRRAFDACETAMTADGQAPMTADEFALLMIVTKEVEFLGKQPAAAARARAFAVAARNALKPGADRRGDAALHLGALLLGEVHPPELTVARTWPANPTADPLLTYFGLYALALAGPGTVRAELQPLEKLVAVRTTDGDDAGSWPASGGFDQITTTAIFATVLGIANAQLR